MMMRIRYETFPDKREYQSLLIINDEARWRETLYFTFYTPGGEEDEHLYAGRAMADFHFKNKPCLCVLAFDFHRWNGDTIDAGLKLELPPVGFDRPLEELLERSLQEREAKPDGFTINIE